MNMAAAFRFYLLMVVAAAGPVGLSGCSRDPHLADETIKPVTVGVVADQGLTLDQDATPAEVVFVLLRAMRDDFKAGEDRAAREAAFDRQLAVCAPGAIIANEPKNLAGTYTRDEYIHKTVWNWTPLVSHYVDQFPATLESCKERVTISPEGAEDGEAAVARLVLADPSGETTDAELEIELVKEEGYWRVAGMHWKAARVVR